MDQDIKTYEHKFFSTNFQGQSPSSKEEINGNEIIMMRDMIHINTTQKHV